MISHIREQKHQKQNNKTHLRIFYIGGALILKKILSLMLIVIILTISASAKDISEITSKSYILLDGKTGNVLLEKDADIQVPPASITKIMNMLLAVEAIDRGEINLDDVVTVSETAAVHEGSHVFLEIGEKITVSDLLKAIAVASGNDASIAIGEYISGSKDNFVNAMNNRAKELGMKNTNFINTNGLDAQGHLSTARDVGIMTYELTKHPLIYDYTTIWMDSLRDGKFQLANTNKLIRFYEGATGMKTGSTSKAGYCLSATAKRGDVELITVVMGAPSSKERFADASTLLNYGFSNYSNVKITDINKIYGTVPVELGEELEFNAIADKTYEITLKNDEKNQLTEKIMINEDIKAPIYKEQPVGKAIYKVGEREVASVTLIADKDIKKVSYIFYLKKLFNNVIQL